MTLTVTGRGMVVQGRPPAWGAAMAHGDSGAHGDLPCPDALAGRHVVGNSCRVRQNRFMIMTPTSCSRQSGKISS
jgi:hypothetical protein